MKKFESPQINVLKFMNADVITTSGDGGYENSGDISPFNAGTFALQPAAGQNDNIPF